MPTLDFEFIDRPIVIVRDRRYVLLDDLRPAIGIQLLPAADVTSIVTPDVALPLDGATVPVWYDGSGVCYVRPAGSAPQRVLVTDMPLWIGLDVQGGLARLLETA